MGRKYMEMIRTFLRDDTGAITVDWVVLTAGIVTAGIATLTVVAGGINVAANGIKTEASSGWSGIAGAIGSAAAFLLPDGFFPNGETFLVTGESIYYSPEQKAYYIGEKGPMNGMEVQAYMVAAGGDTNGDNWVDSQDNGTYALDPNSCAPEVCGDVPLVEVNTPA